MAKKDPKLEKLVKKQATGKQTGRLQDKGPPKGVGERRAITKTTPRMKSLEQAIRKFTRGGGFKKLGLGGIASQMIDDAAAGRVPPRIQKIFDQADASAADKRHKQRKR